jgi:hypothetical protein
MKQCGCFTRRGIPNEYPYKTKKEALEKALKLLEEMNEEFCGKHRFKIVEDGDNFNIVEGK